MRVGLVCPYAWDVPGGVSAHTRDLAQALLDLGHEVSVLTPVDDDDAVLPSYAETTGRTVALPYNGSVARLVLGPVSAARVRRWLRDGGFDVLHLQEPLAPSISLLAGYFATGPVVATFHSANPRSRMLVAAEGLLRPALEKLAARIAVSDAARRTLVEHLGGDAVVIPNGVATAAYAGDDRLPGWPGDGGSVAFLGRLDEPRKGLPVLLAAFRRLAEERPGVRLLLAGPGDSTAARSALPAALRDRVVSLGLLPEADKGRMLRSADVYVAPNTGGESFGIILLEALAAGAPVVASDLEAFRRVLGEPVEGEPAGVVVPAGDDAALAVALGELLDDPVRRAALRAAGRARAKVFDWPVVAGRVVELYETVLSMPARGGGVGVASGG